MISDTIICFYREMAKPGELDVIALWKKRWAQEGWTPVVLDESVAQQDPRWSAMVKKAHDMPCINGAEFEQANFTRWLAFSALDGVVTDYDVFPLRSYPPKDFGGFVCGDPCGGPGFIVGTKADFSKIADDILAYVPKKEDVTWGKPHVSDMLILQKSKVRYAKILSNIQCYGTPGWEKKPLVHFGNHYMKPYTKLPKAEQIRRVLGRIYPK